MIPCNVERDLTNLSMVEWIRDFYPTSTVMKIIHGLVKLDWTCVRVLYGSTWQKVLAWESSRQDIRSNTFVLCYKSNKKAVSYPYDKTDLGSRAYLMAIFPSIKLTKSKLGTSASSTHFGPGVIFYNLFSSHVLLCSIFNDNKNPSYIKTYSL